MTSGSNLVFENFMKFIKSTETHETINDYDLLEKEINGDIEFGKKNYYMSLIDYNDIFMLKIDPISLNLHHCNEIVDILIHTYVFLIIEKKTMLPICFLERNTDEIFNYDNLDCLERYPYISENWQKYKIYKNHIGIYHQIFFYNDKYLCCSKNEIFELEKDTLLQKLMSNYCLDKNEILHFILVKTKAKKILYYNTELIDKEIILLKKYNIDTNITTFLDNEIHFSCFDELLFEMNELHNECVITKKMITGGFILFGENGDKILMENKVYRKIKNMIPSEYQNMDQIYLHLYKQNDLNEIMPYMSNYHVEITKRINFSIKTISREILNLYHMTRKREHSVIYDILPNIYRRILYDIHKIFIDSRNNKDTHHIFDEKKSISIDDVYHYLKRTQTTNVLMLYSTRNFLIEELTKIEKTYNVKDIMITDCVYTKIQTELMNV